MIFTTSTSVASFALCVLCASAALWAAADMAGRYGAADQVAVSRDGQMVGSLPCERIAIAYPEGVSCPRPRVQVNMGRSSDGHVWAAIYGEIFESADGGRTWRLASRLAPSGGVMAFTILRDDTFLAGMYAAEGESYGQDYVVMQSTDRGKSWNRISDLSARPYEYIGADTSCMTQIANGTILLPLARARREWNEWVHEVWHSNDGGRTWGLVPFFTGNETHILQLQSGKLLAAIRRSRYQRFDFDPPGMAMLSQSHSDGAMGKLGFDPPPKAYRMMTATELAQQPNHAYKGICLADSDNGGLSWHSLRPVMDKDEVNVLAYNEVHGQLGQLPDGRVVLVHMHRPVPGDPVGHETIARVSHDEGRTWDRDACHLTTGECWPACLVLEDGTILAVTAGPAAIRFRLPAP